MVLMLSRVMLYFIVGLVCEKEIRASKRGPAGSKATMLVTEVDGCL